MRPPGGRDWSQDIYIVIGGEWITFWAITAQRRKRKTTGSKIQTWITGLFMKQITKKE